MDKLLRVSEASELLSVSPKTLYMWAEQGIVPCLKLMGAVRFERTALIAWLQGCRKGYNLSSSTNPIQKPK